MSLKRSQTFATIATSVGHQTTRSTQSDAGLQTEVDAGRISGVAWVAAGGAEQQKLLPRSVLVELAKWSAARLACFDLVESKAFGGGILCVILANTVLIAMQTDRKLNVDVGWYFSVVDSVFLGVYVLELGLKYYVWRGAFFRSGWNTFDFVIVVISLAEVAWLVVIGSLAGFNPKIFRLLRLFRAIRAFRALRVLRTITFFQNLQIIVSTLLRSIPAWGSISLLLVLVLYIFAIIGVQLYGDIYPQRFGSLWVACFSLFQLITLDDWFQFYDDTRDRSRSMIYYLVIFIVLETFIFVNLFVAVIVNNLETLQRRNAALNKARRERQQQQRTSALRKDASAENLAARANALERDRGNELGDDDIDDSDGSDGGPAPLRNRCSSEKAGARQRTMRAMRLLAALDSSMYAWTSYQGTLHELVDVMK